MKKLMTTFLTLIFVIGVSAQSFTDYSAMSFPDRRDAFLQQDVNHKVEIWKQSIGYNADRLKLSPFSDYLVKNVVKKIDADYLSDSSNAELDAETLSKYLTQVEAQELFTMVGDTTGLNQVQCDGFLEWPSPVGPVCNCRAGSLWNFCNACPDGPGSQCTRVKECGFLYLFTCDASCLNRSGDS